MDARERARIVKDEGLGAKITSVLLDVRGALIEKGYSEEAAEQAVAGALPFCIFRHAQL